MCLAVPGKIVSISQDGHAVADMLGARREVSLRLVPDAALGDFVLVHAGFAIQIIDPREAAETIELMRELDELVEEELPGTAGTCA